MAGGARNRASLTRSVILGGPGGWDELVRPERSAEDLPLSFPSEVGTALTARDGRALRGERICRPLRRDRRLELGGVTQLSHAHSRRTSALDAQ